MRRQPPDQPAVSAPARSLPLAGATNFRDLGGYCGHEGRRVRWRRLFRSDHLAELTEQDAAVLAGLGIRRAFDFRGAQERVARAYDLPGVRQYALSIEPTVVQRMESLLSEGQPLTAADTVALMQQTYRDFVTDNTQRFAELFAYLLASDEPLVFHCTAGKDRTGFAAALILLALGVSHEDVMHDYLLTNQLYRMPRVTSSRAPREVLEVLWRVQHDFLEAALRQVNVEWGGLPDYFERGLGLGLAAQTRLRAMYLQD